MQQIKEEENQMSIEDNLVVANITPFSQYILKFFSPC